MAWDAATTSNVLLLKDLPPGPRKNKKENAVKRTYRPLQMHRIAYTDLTEAQMTQALRSTANGPNGKPAPSATLAGKRLKIVTTDGPTLDYTFRNAKELELSENGGKAVKANYGALDSRSLV